MDWHSEEIDKLIRRALEEDLGPGDATALADALEAEHAVIEPLLTSIDAAAAEAGNGEHFLPCEAERLRILSLVELQRDHAHADEVRAMDALEALRDHGLRT